MTYLNLLMVVGLLIGLIAVVTNPSPYYAAFGLVLSAICGCSFLVDFGVSFLSLVFLLIYLGGMLVVFVYSASLAAEPYPEAWGNWSVLINMIMYFFVMMIFLVIYGLSGFDIFLGNMDELSIIIEDCSGVGYMYIVEGELLFISGLILFLTLFVVLEVTRDEMGGCVRVEK